MIYARILLAGVGILFAWAITVSAAPTKEEEDVAKYAKILKTSTNVKDRVTALKELGRLGAIQVDLTKSVIPEIVKALDDKDPKVRGEAAHTLGRCDPEDKKPIVEKMTKMLKEEKDETVKVSVTQGLAAMGKASSSALPTLREIAKAADKKSAKFYKEAISTISGMAKK